MLGQVQRRASCMNCLMVSHVGFEMMLVYMETLKGGTIVMSPLSRYRTQAPMHTMNKVAQVTHHTPTHMYFRWHRNIRRSVQAILKRCVFLIPHPGVWNAERA